MDVLHTAIWVSDLEEARDFFIEGLGFEEQRSSTIDGAQSVWTSAENGGIQFLHDPDRDDPVVERTAFDHIAVSVDDVDARTEQMVEETGCAVLDGPRNGSTANIRIAFIEGPDGYVVELIEDRD